MTPRVPRAVMSRRARAELAEAIAYIKRDSPQNANAVEEAIEQKIAQIRRFPESGSVDVNVRAPMDGPTPRVVHASGFAIRYVFPLQRSGRNVLYVVSIQRAGRLPPDEPEYQVRLIQEIAGVYARPTAATAPAGSAP